MIRTVSSRKKQRRLAVHEGGQLARQLIVEVRRSSEEWCATWPQAVASRRHDRGIGDFRPIRKSEVVVRSEVDEVRGGLRLLRAVHCNPGRGRRLHRHPEHVPTVLFSVSPPFSKGLEDIEGVRSLVGARLEVGESALSKGPEPPSRLGIPHPCFPNLCHWYPISPSILGFAARHAGPDPRCRPTREGGARLRTPHPTKPGRRLLHHTAAVPPVQRRPILSRSRRRIR